MAGWKERAVREGRWRREEEDQGLVGVGVGREKEEDESWSARLEARWKFEPQRYYSLHLCLV